MGEALPSNPLLIANFSTMYSSRRKHLLQTEKWLHIYTIIATTAVRFVVL